MPHYLLAREVLCLIKYCLLPNKIVPIFRCMECLLHIAYRMDFKKTQAKTPLEKLRVRFRRGIIQEDLKLQLALRVDVPRQGSGTTNDGNTAFFDNPALTAKILNLDENLVTRISVIAKTLNSGFFIDVKKFREYCLSTYQMYLNKYGWYRIPPTLHKILLHGADIIDHCQKKGLPISALSEEPQETRNKDLKKFREDRARKVSR